MSENFPFKEGSTSWPFSNTPNFPFGPENNFPFDDNQNFPFTNSGAAPVITSTSFDQMTVGQTGIKLRLTATTSDPAASPWSVVSGDLPEGLSLNAATGLISGDPVAAGTSNVTVRYTDEYGRTDDQALVLVVNAAPEISTSPDAGTVSTPYTFAMEATGGTLPIVWSVDALPDGLIMGGDGVITGTPTTADSTISNFIVTDANGIADTYEHTFVIN